ncbi:MAG: FAD:protein FMN transferase [Bacteroidetes bacterium]|nr:MAG: FAD:protein FMN transferase [Bacteroidota bacterium]
MRYSCLFLSLLLLPGFWACQSQPIVPIKLEGPAQGTSYHITYYGEGAADWQPDIDSLLERVNESLSTYHEGSLINQFNQADSLVTDDPLFIEMVDRSRAIARTSEGTFDPSVMPLVRAWGFGPDNALVPKVENLDSLRQFIGMEKILERPGPNGGRVFTKAQPGVQLDFNAIAQGYTVDLLSRYLEQRGIVNYLVELGGEVRTRGENPEGESWTLGVEKPIDIAGISELATLIELGDMAAATSGNYRKFYEQDGVRYSHTIDPATGRPVQHTLLSTTVLAADGTTADAYATAFMVMGLARAKAFITAHPELELEAYFISSAAPGNYVFDATPGMQRRLRAVAD